MGCVQSALKTDADLEELYSLGECIGEGVEGRVYLATCNSTGQQVAIKLVARGPDLGLGPEKVRREIQLQARLDHVNIVELKQVLLTKQHLAIVMSYEGGGDLHSYARKYTMNEEVARYFFRQIVEGLDYCHTNHIAHRDLKLANFLLSTDKPMRVRLCDFGCARHWDTKHVPERRLARFSTFAGTPAYMSPQVLQSAFYPTNTYNAVEADVWALGIVLCHLFFGAHTPFWLEPNAFRNEGATMQARIQAMKGQNWVDSDEFVKANVTALSPELRDLLDKIFIMDEFKRITIQGIKEHPWYLKELPPFLQDALDTMAKEQVLRDSLQRATVSLAANRHDTGVNGTGDFATIDLLVDMAQKYRKMPGGGAEKVFCLDMAHMELGPLSQASVSTVESCRVVSPTAADASAHRSTHGLKSDQDAAVAVNGTSLYDAVHVEAERAHSNAGTDDEDDDEGTQHSRLSRMSSLGRVAATGNKSTHLSLGDHVEGMRFKKTLSLRRSDGGLVVGSYVLQPAEDRARSDAGLRSESWMQGLNSQQVARSVHGGMAFFREAASRADTSMHAGQQAYSSRTVHGGTAHAAALAGQPGGIFVQGHS